MTDKGNTMDFAHKLHKILTEGIRQGGHEVTKGYMPEEFDPNETNVNIEFDWAPMTSATHHDPGEPGGIWITKVTTEDGQELDIDQIPDELRKHFEEIAEEHLHARDQRALADRDDAQEAKRDERQWNEIERTRNRRNR